MDADVSGVTYGGTGDVRPFAQSVAGEVAPVAGQVAPFAQDLIGTVQATGGPFVGNAVGVADSITPDYLPNAQYGA